MPYIADANELRIQAIEAKMLGKAKWVSIGSLVLTAVILSLA